MAEVRIPTILRAYTGGERVVECPGGTIGELVDNLESAHTGIKERLVEANDTGWAVRRYINIYVNDEDIRFTGALATPIADADTVVILPAVAGGASAPCADGTVAGG